MISIWSPTDFISIVIFFISIFKKIILKFACITVQLQYIRTWFSKNCYKTVYSICPLMTFSFCDCSFDRCFCFRPLRDFTLLTVVTFFSPELFQGKSQRERSSFLLLFCVSWGFNVSAMVTTKKLTFKPNFFRSISVMAQIFQCNMKNLAMGVIISGYYPE